MIRAHKFNDYDYVYICDKETVKEWLKSKGWTELHEMVSDGGNARGGDHVPLEKIFENIDNCEAVAIYTRNVHDNHRLTLMMGGMKILYYNVLEVMRDELDEYSIPKPYCKRCNTLRARGAGQTGCTPNWDDSKDMEWNLLNEKNKPYYKEHEWNRDYEKYE